MLSGPDGSVLYDKLGLDIFFFSEWPYSNTKNWLRQSETPLSFT